VIIKSFENGTIFGAFFEEKSNSVSLKDVRILAFHGWQRTHKDYDNILTKIPWPSLALDLPGFGLSKEPQSPLDSIGYAQLIRPIAENISVPFILVGHSFGGRVAVALASQIPEKIVALVLIATPIYRANYPSVKKAYSFIKWLKAHKLIPEPFYQKAFERYSSSDYLQASELMRKVMINVLNEERTGFYLELIKKIPKPIYFIWGEKDNQTPIEMIKVLNDANNYHFVIDKNSSHLILLENPDLIVSNILAIGKQNGF
jgi:pimeloyl-ACP methyl ester carboxylesterase